MPYESYNINDHQVKTRVQNVIDSVKQVNFNLPQDAVLYLEQTAEDKKGSISISRLFGKKAKIDYESLNASIQTALSDNATRNQQEKCLEEYDNALDCTFRYIHC